MASGPGRVRRAGGETLQPGGEDSLDHVGPWGRPMDAEQEAVFSRDMNVAMASGGRETRESSVKVAAPRVGPFFWLPTPAEGGFAWKLHASPEQSREGFRGTHHEAWPAAHEELKRDWGHLVPADYLNGLNYAAVPRGLVSREDHRSPFEINTDPESPGHDEMVEAVKSRFGLHGAARVDHVRDDAYKPHLRALNPLRRALESGSPPGGIPPGGVPVSGPVAGIWPGDGPHDTTPQEAFELTVPDAGKQSLASRWASYDLKVEGREDGWVVVDGSGNVQGGPFAAKGQALKELQELRMQVALMASAGSSRMIRSREGNGELTAPGTRNITEELTQPNHIMDPNDLYPDDDGSLLGSARAARVARAVLGL